VYYHELTKEAEPINRAKQFEENIGRRHLIYIFSRYMLMHRRRLQPQDLNINT